MQGFLVELLRAIGELGLLAALAWTCRLMGG